VSPVLIAVLGALGLLLLVALVVVTRIKVAGPNQAFLITGRKGRPVTNPETGLVSTDMSGQKVIMGASVFVLPFVQKLHVLELSSRRLQVGIRGAVSANGIKCDLEGVAIVKVAGTEDSIRAAAQRFLDQQGDIEVFTQEVLAGSLRSIVGRLTVEEIIKDRAAFASAVAEEAETSLTNQGLQLDTFQLQDIQAEGNYLADLGRPEAARMQQAASIAEARARQAAEQERLLAEEAIAIAERTFALKTPRSRPRPTPPTPAPTPPGRWHRRPRPGDPREQEKVAVKQAALKERQLDTEVRKPADAQRYRSRPRPRRPRTPPSSRPRPTGSPRSRRAQASAEQQKLSGEGERSRRAALAEAEAIEGARTGDRRAGPSYGDRRGGPARGRGRGVGILARGKAEAEALDSKARAFQDFGEAAVLDLLVKILRTSCARPPRRWPRSTG
jgi:flotillin